MVGTIHPYFDWLLASAGRNWGDDVIRLDIEQDMEARLLIECE